MVKKFISVLSLLLMLVSSTGCSFDKPAQNNPPKTKTKPESVGIKVYVNENIKYPLAKGFPLEIVPILENSKIAASSKTEDPQKNVYYSVIFTTDQKVNDVLNYYQQALQNVKDLRVTGKDQNSSLTGTKGKKSFVVSILQSEVNGKAKTMVIIKIRPKQKASKK